MNTNHFKLALHWLVVFGFYLLFTFSLKATPLPPELRNPQLPYVLVFKTTSIDPELVDPFVQIFTARGYHVYIVHPGQSKPRVVNNASLYIVPGGEDVDRLRDAMTKKDRRTIRRYVRNGGRYYGSCLGGYWADAWSGQIPGFRSLHILPATAFEISAQDRSDRIIQINWQCEARAVYFQDGPGFVITDPSKVITLYATYADPQNTPCVFLSQFGAGKVLVTGVHLEAPLSWYQEFGLPAPPHLNRDLLDQVIDDLLK